MLCAGLGLLMLIGAVGCITGETEQSISEATPGENGGEETIIIASGESSTQTVAPGATERQKIDETPAPVLTPEPITTRPPIEGDVSTGRFPDHDTGMNADWSYQSDELRIAIDRHENEEDKIVYYVADIYLQDIKRLATAAAGDNFASKKVDKLRNIAQAHEALFALSGDYFNYQSKGLIIRNGVLYRQKYDNRRDLCVLYTDGVMKTFEAGTYTMEEIIASEPWQTWQFGPELLDANGHAKEKFNSSLTGLNPRCAIGCIEPGHYCFVIVDGRQEKYSNGATMQELARIMEKLGCTTAYNLDGGQSAQMYFNGKFQNQTHGAREIGDILYFRAKPN